MSEQESPLNTSFTNIYSNQHDIPPGKYSCFSVEMRFGETTLSCILPLLSHASIQQKCAWRRSNEHLLILNSHKHGDFFKGYLLLSNCQWTGMPFWIVVIMFDVTNVQEMTVKHQHGGQIKMCRWLLVGVNNLYSLSFKLKSDFGTTYFNCLITKFH